jgi:hypothetical protein
MGTPGLASSPREGLAGVTAYGSKTHEWMKGEKGNNRLAFGAAGRAATSE